ncbi:MAG TPA: trypsin-like peptidase domain-containing protein [Methylomirabilota bacterium]
MFRPFAFVALLLVPVALLPVAAAAREPSLQEALLRAKPAVAMVVSEVGSEVTLDCGDGRTQTTSPAPVRETGTGWFIAADGWLITNGHVVAPAQQPPASLRDDQADKAVRALCGRTLPAVAARARVTLQPSLFVILSNGIRLSASVVKSSPPVDTGMSGRDLALLRLEASDMPVLRLADSSRLQIGDRLHIIGFPDVVLTHELLNASAKVEATVTNGAVSGFKQDVANQTVIQTDASSTTGNSGGPAVNSAGDVVGVLTFVSSTDAEREVQGFNFVIPSAAVKEFVAGTDADKGGPSRFNAAWYAALAEFFDGDYAAAGRHLTEANRLLPELPDVRRLTAENSEKLKNPPPRPFPWALVASVITVASLAIYGGMWGRRWQRNRYRIAPSEVARLIESASSPPMILDARDAATYAKSPVRIPNAVHITAQELESGVTRLPVETDRTVVAYCT